MGGLFLFLLFKMLVEIPFLIELDGFCMSDGRDFILNQT